MYYTKILSLSKHIVIKTNINFCAPRLKSKTDLLLKELRLMFRLLRNPKPLRLLVASVLLDIFRGKVRNYLVARLF